MSGTRAELLVALQSYAAQGPLGETEAAVAAEMIAFVTREPRCAERSLAEGHLTGSAWIVDSSGEQVLLLHHRKLGKWLQPGGHADGDFDLARVAEREAREETGLIHLRAAEAGIFDVDRHWIPPRREEPGHWHYDVRFLFLADAREPLVANRESRGLAWVVLSQITHYSREESILRMVRKSARLKPAARDY